MSPVTVRTFDSMVGVTMEDVRADRSTPDDKLIFVAADGRRWKFMHRQSCCESVAIEDIAGDLADLIGSPIVTAEEVSNLPEPEVQYANESHTWTFYRFATAKGSVTVRWLGESNGYYSEGVDFFEPSEVAS